MIPRDRFFYPNGFFFLLTTVFSRVFQRINTVIKIGLSGRAARSWLTFWLTFLQIQFSRKVFNLRASNFTWFLQGLCFHVMPCSFQLVPNFLEIGIFFIYFFSTNFCVYSITPKLFKVFGWTFIGMEIQMIRHAAHKWHNSSLLTFLVISLCIFLQFFVYAL